MNQYLLLRDNKQTGPYSFEELVKKGLKKYDLVWLEGRSAAWRYPSEFDELKPYSPEVEEQPYDRFYKKPGEQAAQSVTQQAVTTSNNIQETQTAAQQVSVQASDTSTKKIFVTMPAGKTQVAASKPKEEVKKEEKPQPVQQQANKQSQQPSATAAKGTYLISEDDDELNSAMLKGYNSKKKETDESNSSFLNDYEARKAAYQTKKTDPVLEEQPVQPAKKETPVTAAVKSDKPAYTASHSAATKKDRKQLFAIPARLNNSSFFQDNKTVLIRSLVAACLILGGVVIGLVINSGKRHGDSQVLETLVKEIREQNKDKGSVTSPNDDKPTTKQEELSDNNDNSDNLNNYTDQSTLPNSTTEPPARHAINKKDATQAKQPVAVPVSNPSPAPAEPQPAVIETKEKVNNETIEKARRNIYDLVGIEASQYKVGLLGGISELDITISNNSLYALDQVDVEVKYYGPERKLVKTQTIKFNHVPAGKQRTLEVPRSSRGISIDYSITGINSKALGLAQAGY